MYPYINVFGHAVQTYYICAALAFLVGFVMSVIALKRRKHGLWAVLLPLLVAVVALVSARLLNYITNPRAYTDDFTVWSLSYMKLSLMGGLIGGVAVLIVYCLLRRLRLGAVADAFTLPAAAGIVLLKLGCFLNGCCHGVPTDGPFGMIFPANEVKYRFINSLKTVKAKSPIVHPTQLYEIVGAVAAVVLALVLTRTLKLREGSRAAIFALGFAAARWIILPQRELPYDPEVVSVLYPLLYAGVILCAGIYLIYINKKDS